jgi:hypothetical protein
VALERAIRVPEKKTGVSPRNTSKACIPVSSASASPIHQKVGKFAATHRHADSEQGGGGGARRGRPPHQPPEVVGADAPE